MHGKGINNSEKTATLKIDWNDIPGSKNTFIVKKIYVALKFLKSKLKQKIS